MTSNGVRDAQLQLGEKPIAGGVAPQSPGPRGAQEAAGACAVAGVDDSPGWEPARMDRWAALGSDRDHGRRDQ